VEVYGIATRESGDVDERNESRDEAEQVLALVLEDAPELADDLYVAKVELAIEGAGRSRPRGESELRRPAPSCPLHLLLSGLGEKTFAGPSMRPPGRQRRRIQAAQSGCS
jgi:hypothetical protein